MINAREETDESRTGRELQFRVNFPRAAVGIGVCIFFALAYGCSKSNDLLLGRVESRVGPYLVIVTDCYRIAVPLPKELEASSGAITGYHFTPCRDADVLIESGRLTVNGSTYGMLSPGDTVIVDHGTVSIGSTPATLR